MCACYFFSFVASFCCSFIVLGFGHSIRVEVSFTLGYSGGLHRQILSPACARFLALSCWLLLLLQEEVPSFSQEGVADLAVRDTLHGCAWWW